MNEKACNLRHYFMLGLWSVWPAGVQKAETSAKSVWVAVVSKAKALTRHKQDKLKPDNSQPETVKAKEDKATHSQV